MAHHRVTHPIFLSQSKYPEKVERSQADACFHLRKRSPIVFRRISLHFRNPCVISGIDGCGGRAVAEFRDRRFLRAT